MEHDDKGEKAGGKGGGMLEVFRGLRGKGKKGEEPPGDAPSGASPFPPADKATFGDFARAAGELDAVAGGAGDLPGDVPPGDVPPGDVPPGDEPATDLAAFASAAGIDEALAAPLLEASKKLPAVADLAPAELGKRVKEDFDLRMKLESLAARSGRGESEGPTPWKGSDAGSPAPGDM